MEWIDEHGDPRSALEFSNEQSVSALDSDLLDAELVLGEIMKQSNQSQAKKKTASSAETKVSPKREDERRNELIAVIQKFVGAAKPGDELPLSSELTSFDRMLVHEEAEKLGIEHHSEGDGLNRRIILFMPETKQSDAQETPRIEPVASSVINETSPSEDEGESGQDQNIDRAAPQFAALNIDDDADDDDEGEDYVVEVAKPVGADAVAEVPVSNLLSSLAAERMARERQRLAVTRKPSSKMPKKHGGKLGGTKKGAPPSKDDNDLDGLDDMAFLDAQIDKVQNSHGRKIDARGTGYRTIVNGILLDKPKPEGKKKDDRAAAALQKKLQQAQADRKTKSKKK